MKITLMFINNKIFFGIKSKMIIIFNDNNQLIYFTTYMKE